MDLAELYKSDVVSKETAEQIRAHLKTCPDCRRYYREYDMHDTTPALALPTDEELSGAETRLYHNLSRRMAMHRLWQIIGTSAAIGAGTIMLAVGIIMTVKTPNGKL
jgi:predicted anti-sigma-YlaC factor YlaD